MSLRSPLGRLCAGAGTLAVAAVLVAMAMASGSRAIAGFQARALKVVKADLRHMTAPNMPAPLRLARPTPSANVTQKDSYDWSGYADVTTTTNKFGAVSGKWTVAKLSCTSEDRIESTWVGLDGANDGTVEQLGTVSQCFQDQAVHYSWYEIYPASEVVVSKAVKGGDQISASVTRSGTSYTLKLTDSTTSGNNINVTKSCSSCKNQDAEWIVERPELDTTGTAPLANFSSTGFTSGSETAGGTKGTIASVSPYEYTMRDSTDSYNLAKPSSLTNGNEFTDSWKNSY